MEKNRLAEIPSNFIPIPDPNFADCFGCSRKKKYGLQLKFWYSNTEKRCYSYYSIPRYFSGFKGLAHDGIIATILDEIAAWLLICNLGKMGVTVEANIKYHKPVPIESEITIEAHFQAQIGQNVTIISQVTRKGDLLAECTTHWFIPSESSLAKIVGKSPLEIETYYQEMILPIRQAILKTE